MKLANYRINVRIDNVVKAIAAMAALVIIPYSIGYGIDFLTGIIANEAASDIPFGLSKDAFRWMLGLEVAFFGGIVVIFLLNVGGKLLSVFVEIERVEGSTE